MPVVQNLTNAWVRIKHGSHVLQIDPWITQGANLSWYHSRPLVNPRQHLEGTTHVAITHLHEDHFDLPLLLSLPDSATFLIPDIGPNRIVMAKPLQDAGKTVVMLPVGDVVNFGEISFLVIPPLDGRSETYSIDAGIMVRMGDWRGLFMADNVPRNTDVGELMQRQIEDVDLLALSHNGLASDYPLCYGFSDIEIGDITRQREEERFRLNCAFIRKVNPKELMLYSSDMAIAGHMYEKFRKWSNWGWWGVGDAPFYPGLYARCKYRKELMVSVVEPDFRDADVWYASEDERNLVVIDPLAGLPEAEYVDIGELFSAAAKNAMKHVKGSSHWWFRLHPTDGLPDQLACVLGPNEPYAETAGNLSVWAPKKLLVALLSGKVHWNTAQISFMLKWDRTPNTFCPEIHDAINHFHA